MGISYHFIGPLMLNFDEAITLDEKNRKILSVADGSQKCEFLVTLNSIEKLSESIVLK